MTNQLRAVSLDFVNTAPIVHTFHLDIAATPARVYDALSDSPATWTWMPSVKGGSWLGDARGVGGRREIRIGPARITETVLAAEPGVRWAYRVDTSSVPMAKTLLEDWVLTEVPATSTRPASTHAAYSFFIDPLRFAGPLTRAMGVGLAQVAKRAERNLDRLLGTSTTG